MAAPSSLWLDENLGVAFPHSIFQEILLALPFRINLQSDYLSSVPQLPFWSQFTVSLAQVIVTAFLLVCLCSYLYPSSLPSTLNLFSKQQQSDALKPASVHPTALFKSSNPNPFYSKKTLTWPGSITIPPTSLCYYSTLVDSAIATLTFLLFQKHIRHIPFLWLCSCLSTCLVSAHL